MDEKVERRVGTRKGIISFFLGLVILYALFSQVDLKRTFYIAKTINISFYCLAFFSVYISIFLRVVRWQILLNNAGYRSPLTELSEILFLSWFVNCLVPAKLGDIYRGYLYKKSKKISSASGVLGTVFIERTLDIFFMVILFSVVGLSVFEGRMPGNIRLSLWIGLILCIALLTIIWILKTQRRHFHYFPGRLESIFSSFEEGTTNSLTKKSVPSIVFFTVLIWFLEGARLLFVLKSLSIELAIPIIFFIAIGSSFLTSIPLTPAGLGAVEVAITGLLVLFGTDKEVAVSVALLDRLLSYWSVVILGGILYILSERT